MCRTNPANNNSRTIRAFIASPWCSTGKDTADLSGRDEEEAHCLSDLSQASRRGLAQARILRHSRPPGVGTRDHDATRRAGNPVVESAVAARDPQAEPERSPDGDSQHRLPDFGGAFGSGHVRPMVSGKLLPIYAAKLQFG